MKQITDIRYTLNFATPSDFGSMLTNCREIRPDYYEPIFKALDSEGWRIIDSTTISNSIIDDDENVIYVSVNTHIYLWNSDKKMNSTFKKITEIENA